MIPAQLTMNAYMDDVICSSMALEYRSANQACPLIVLPRMGFFYGDDDLCFQTRFSRGLIRMLNTTVESGGEFRIERVNSDLIVLKMDQGDVQFWCSLNSINGFIVSLARVQRRIRQRRAKMHVVAAFHRSNWGLALPVDILKKVTHMCFERRYTKIAAVKVILTSSML